MLRATGNEESRLRTVIGNWDGLADAQKTVCLAVYRLGGNAAIDEVADCCGASVADVQALCTGVHGILIDGSTDRVWLR